MRVLIGCDKPCPNGAVGQRGPNGRCRCDACNTADCERKRKWSEQNADRVAAYSRKYRQRNPEKAAEANAAWRAKNPEKTRKMALKAGAKWSKKRKDKRAAMRATSRALAKQRLASWADLAAIERFYTEAARLTEVTGIPHEVDHIIPLNGDGVSGLHVENNLQIVTRQANRQKGNSFDGA